MAVLISDLDIRVVDTNTGELLRRLTLVLGLFTGSVECIGSGSGVGGYPGDPTSWRKGWSRGAGETHGGINVPGGRQERLRRIDV